MSHENRRQPPLWSVSTGRPKLPLSGFIICMNEEEYLANCIESLEQCSEIIIVDSGSTDGTHKLIQGYAAAGWPVRLIYEKWRGYAGQKQFALEQCTQPWCFSIDADERLDESLKDALPGLLQGPDSVVGYMISRRLYLIGYGYAPQSVEMHQFLRLIRNGQGVFDLKQRVHEGIIPQGKVIGTKSGSLLHYRPLPMHEQILKENQYSTLKAEQFCSTGRSRGRLKLLINPPLYFLRLYLKDGLWRCGFAGLIQAMTGMMYSALTEAKIYQREMLKIRPNVDDLGTRNERKHAA